jgi:hypothetical protein
MRYFILAVLLLAAAPLPGYAQDELEIQGSGPLKFYESPTFGYVVQWDENEADWVVESTDSGPDGDILVLSQAGEAITFRGYEGHGGDPEACRMELALQLAETSRAELHFGIDSEGKIIAGGDEYIAWAVFVVDAFDDAGGNHPETVWHLECRRLIPGSAVLAITLEVSRDRYDEFDPTGLTFAPIELAYRVMDSVVMPRVSYDFDDGDGQPVVEDCDFGFDLPYDFPLPPRLLLGNSGEVVGMATVVQDRGLHPDPPDEPGPWDLYVLFENTGSEALIIDPLGVEVTASSRFGEGEKGCKAEHLRPSKFEWETGNGDLSAEPQTIEPGKRLIVQLMFAEPFFEGAPPGVNRYVAEYHTEETSSVIIGAWDEGGSGGGRPRLS